MNKAERFIFINKELGRLYPETPIPLEHRFNLHLTDSRLIVGPMHRQKSKSCNTRTFFSCGQS